VRRIREQGQAARPKSADDFGDEDGEGQQHGEDETVFDGFVGVGVHKQALSF